MSVNHTNPLMEKEETKKDVQDYYSQTLKTSADLQTNACCLASTGGMPTSHMNFYLKIHETIRNKFYGCGSPLPEELTGLTVLDLGCGTGRDVYIASGLVGQSGRVIGVDMTPEQVDTAEHFKDYQREAFGFDKSNVEFKVGEIEDLKKLGIEDKSIDVLISNCVLNLCTNKGPVLKEIYRVLKDGGELYFSDVYSDRRVPDSLQKDKVLWGECLSGALYTEDFRRVMQSVGFTDFRVISKSRITVGNPKIQEQLGDIKFYSITIRAFKLQGLEDKCEDYGQTVTYKGTIKDFEDEFILDNEHSFSKGETVRVCRNTATMLSNTRFGKHFEVSQAQEHRGVFDCSANPKKIKYDSFGQEIIEEKSGSSCC